MPSKEEIDAAWLVLSQAVVRPPSLTAKLMLEAAEKVRVTDSYKQLQNQGWQPIETAPRGVEILVYGRVGSALDNIKPSVFVAKYGEVKSYLASSLHPKIENPVCDSKETRWILKGNAATSVFPTHWMPLPEQPKQPAT